MSKLVKKMLPPDWLNFYEQHNLLDDFTNILAHLFSQSFYDRETRHLINNGNTLFPPLNKCTEFLRRIKPEEVKLVIVVREPYNNGEATCIPLELDYTKSKQRFPLAENVSDLEILEDAYARYSHDVFTGINFNSFFNEGVLFYPTTLFSVEKQYETLRTYYLELSRRFLRALNKPVISLGDSEVIDLLEANMKQLTPIPSRYNRTEFLRYNLFKKIQEQHGIDIIKKKG